DFPIPGNDDAGRAVTLYCDLIARAAIDGIERAQVDAGIDIGASAQPMAEELPVAGFQGIEGPRGEADDLKRIAGVTEKVEQRLNDAGVFHYWQIADLDEANAKLLDAKVKLEAGQTSFAWVAAARKLVEAEAA
ncbi:MAG: 30S ribosomal protein S2, partial [Hyphomicrobiaceae bacterium]|nr:30S ribosomal protein S2 [Hyphomicrobiaceae bacterium]